MKHTLKIPIRILILTAFSFVLSAVHSVPAITVLADAADTDAQESFSSFWKNASDHNEPVSDEPDDDDSDADDSENNDFDNDGSDDNNSENDDADSDFSDQDDPDADWGSFDQDDSDWNDSEDEDTDSDTPNHGTSENDPPSSGDDTPVSTEPSDPDEKNDPQKPDAVPTSVAASVRPLKSSQTALIRWKPVAGAYAYKVQRSKNKDGKYTNIASLGEDGSTYTDNSVKRGSSYFYRIAAKLKSGGACYSKVLSFTRPLSAVNDVRLVRYSTSSVKVFWEKSREKQAEYYKVYYAKGSSDQYKLAGTTKNTWYRVKSLKNNQDYNFRVRACAASKTSPLDSDLSKTVSIRTKPYQRTTIFAGDSLTVGFRTYNVLNEIAIGGNKRVVAAVGLNTTTFRTRRVFDGKSGLESIVSSKTYRVYLMLGDNDIHYRRKEDVLAAYEAIVKGIRTGSPETDIVVLAATPVTSAQVAKRKGFAQIPAYNQGLKALAERTGAKYYDCTAFLKDSNGCLKSAYDAGDGIHWKAAAYHEYAGFLEAYDKSLDENS